MSGNYNKSPEHKERTDKRAVNIFIDRYGGTIFDPIEAVSSLMYPNAEQRFNREYQASWIDDIRSEFKIFKGISEIVQGWSENTKRYALLHALVATIAESEHENVNYELASGTPNEHPGLLRRNRRKIEACEALKKQLLERK